MDAPDEEITPGTTETYRIRVVNDGPSVADDVVVTDTLPAGLTATAWRVESVTPPGPTPACVDGTATCDLGDLPPARPWSSSSTCSSTASLEIDPAVGVANTADRRRRTPTIPTTDDNTSTFTASGGAAGRRVDPQVRPAPSRRSAGDTVTGDAGLARSRLEIVNFGPSATSNLVSPMCCRPG